MLKVIMEICCCKGFIECGDVFVFLVKPFIYAAIPNLERFDVVPANHVSSLELSFDEKTRVSAFLEFRFAAVKDPQDNYSWYIEAYNKEGYSQVILKFTTTEQFRYCRECLVSRMITKSENKPKNKLSISGFLLNHLPEESKGNLLDLQERWRTDSKSPLLIELKTMNFWFRHWKCDICSEIGKKVQKSLPSRWI
jgi:hypothetical protein